ncbi:MAG TPA: RusA family crossover junction endodeoxyribonuclease [Arthrobacter sp.]
MSAVRIVADGTPAPQGSKRHVGGGRMVEVSKNLPAWRAAVEAAARLAAGPAWVPWDGPVSVSGTVAILRPGSTKFKDFPAGAPDLDKIQRAIGDALEKSRLITNDSRICHWNIRKVWAIGVPGMDIEVRQIES